jgi:hypothetical protein
MIFRAIFWIGLIVLLASRQPDSGLPRHGLHLALPSIETIQAELPRPSCTGCARRSLTDVKVEIDASIAARAGDFHAF